MPYIDGVIIPVKTARRDEYLAAAREITALYCKHGATRCVEAWATGLDQGKRTSFPRAVEAAPDESIVFSWMEFADKAASEAAHKAVWAEPTMQAMMENDLIDGARMVFGGFDVMLDVR